MSKVLSMLDLVRSTSKGYIVPRRNDSISLEKAQLVKIREGIRNLFNMRGKYPLGKGGYGIVMYAMDNDYRGYAVKYIGKGKKGVENNEDVIREVYYSNLFNHPNIVKFYNYGVYLDDSYILMDVADESLGSYMRHVKLNYEQKLSIMYDIGKAIDYIHRGGFVHCDIKSENILMFRDVPKISDLGFTRFLETYPRKLNGRKICSTVYYQPPEYAIRSFGSQKIHHVNEIGVDDEKNEYWSYGITCIDILTNKGDYIFNLSRESFDYFIGIINLLNALDRRGESYRDIFLLNLKIIEHLEGEKDNILLDHILAYLLVVKRENRDLHRFLNNSIFEAFKKEDIQFVHTLMNHDFPGYFDDTKLRQTIEFLFVLSRSIQTPKSILLNTIDYFIQNANVYCEEEYSVYSCAILYIFYVISNIKKNTSAEFNWMVYMSLNSGFASQGKSIIEYDQINSKFLEITSKGPIIFESLYYALPSMELVDLALFEIETDVKSYLKHRRPIYYANYLKSKHHLIIAANAKRDENA